MIAMVIPFNKLTIDCTLDLMLVFETLPEALFSRQPTLDFQEHFVFVGARFNLKCGTFDQSASGAR